MACYAPRLSVYSTTALRPELRDAFDRAAKGSVDGLAKALGVTTHVVQSLMFGGKRPRATVERVELAFSAYLLLRGLS
ncbi:MAG TPA: hypothetical protein VF287_06875 [Usitatibacter sp.]